MSDLDTYLRCLANRHRRVLLYDLREWDVTSVDELAATLSAAASSPAHGRGLDHEEAVAALRHNHLPTLQDLSVVDYDARTGTVRVLEYPPELRSLLAVTERFDGEE